MFFIGHFNSRVCLSKIGRVLGAGVLALSLALVMDAALGMASAHANPITVTVAPNSPNGWVYFTETVGSAGLIPFDMVNPPPPAVLGQGSARFVLTSAPVGNMLAAGLYGGTPLSAFTTLTYSAFLSTHVSAPALQLGMDFDGTDAAAGWQGRLVYAPTGLTNTWQIFDAQSGAFWFATQHPYNTLCSMGTPCTWSQVLTNWPNAAIHTNTVGGLGFIGLKAGSGFAAYTAYADALTVAASGSTTVFDFEPCASVHNVNTGNRYCTIQSAINDSATLPGHTLMVSAGLFNEAVVVTKNNLTLVGARPLAIGEALDINTQSVISNAAPVAYPGAPGIQVNAGVTGFTLKNIRVQGFGNGGVCALGANHNLLIDHVQVYSNTAGAGCLGGLYLNGPVNHVSVSNSDARYNTSRGMVIWNGFKQNITFTNNYVGYNNCCGLELQDGTASGVTVLSNTIEYNADSGMSLVGLTGGAGPNVVLSNTVRNNGRFGIEVKLPNGSGLPDGDGSIVVAYNTVELTQPITALRPTEERDLAGIAVYRRGYLVGAGYNDIPTGVMVRDNTVQGYQQSNPASDSEGFGLVLEGVKMRATNNTLQNNDVGLQRQQGHLPYTPNTNIDGDQGDLADQYFGRGNAPVVCAALNGNSFASNTVDSRDVGGASNGLITNLNTGIDYCTIQSAIDDPTTLPGHTIFLQPGVYVQTYLSITKGLTLTAAPNSATLRPAANHPDILATGAMTNGSLIWIAAPNVTLSNLILDGDNPNLSGGHPVNGADVNAVRGVHLRDAPHDNLTIENVTLRNLGRAIDVRSGANHRFQFNTLENIGGPDANYGYGVLVFNTAGVLATHNTLRDLSTAGLFVQNHFNTNPVIFSHNTLTNASIALGVNLVYGGATYTVAHNSVYSTSLAMQITSIQIANLQVVGNAITLTQPGDYGLYVWNTWPNTTRLLSNTVQGGYAPLWVSDLDSTFGAGPVHVLAQGNVLSGAAVGAGLESRAGGVTATLHNNTFANLTHGVWVEAGAANRVNAVIGGAVDTANIFTGNSRNITVTAPLSNPVIQATFNDWGVAGADNIASTLYHQADDPALARIHYFTLTLEAVSPLPADGSGGAVTATLSGLLTPAPATVNFAATPGTINPASAATAPSTATTTFGAAVTGTATLTATVANVSASTTVTLVDSAVQSFVVSPLTTQFPGQAFTLVITATDNASQPVPAYTGYAALTDTTQTLTPGLVGPFVNGVAVVSASVAQAIPSTAITASHPTLPAITGSGLPFAVVAVQAENSSPTALGDSTFFTATSAPDLTYVWDFGNGLTATGSTTSHVYAVASTYTATVTASNNLGSVSASTPVTVTHTFGVQVAPTTVTQTVYPFQAVTFTVRVTNTGSSPDTFTVTLSAGGFGGTLSTPSLTVPAGEGAEVLVTASAPGLLTAQTFQHTLAVTSSAPGVSASATLTLVVQPHRLFLPLIRR